MRRGRYNRHSWYISADLGVGEGVGVIVGARVGVWDPPVSMEGRIVRSCRRPSIWRFRWLSARRCVRRRC